MRVVVRTRSTQKLPSVCVRRRDEPADQRDRDRGAGRRRHEVVHREPGHLA